jgi:hypothetical protein
MKEEDKSDPFDLDNLVIETAPKAAPKSTRKRKAEADFVRLPFPLAIRLGGKASGAAWAVLACLVDMEFQTWVKGQPLILTNCSLQKWNVSPDQKLRALTELENLGIVYVKREPRKSPRVTFSAAQTR